MVHPTIQMSAPPSKPPSRKPVTAFVAKPEDSDIKVDKDYRLRLEEKMDRIFEPRSETQGVAAPAPDTINDIGFQDVKSKIRAPKEMTKIADYSKDLSDHEEPAEDSEFQH